LAEPPAQGGGSFAAAVEGELRALEGASDLAALAARLQKGLRYTIGEPLGSGGMGVVFAAWDPELERRVALKILHRDEPSTIERLLREARAQARVEHPHACRVYEVGRVEGTPYVAMQLIDGPHLAEAATHMTVAEKLRTMSRVATPSTPPTASA
jgi:serine/threonine protein kinase